MPETSARRIAIVGPPGFGEIDLRSRAGSAPRTTGHSPRRPLLATRLGGAALGGVARAGSAGCRTRFLDHRRQLQRHHRSPLRSCRYDHLPRPATPYLPAPRSPTHASIPWPNPSRFRDSAPACPERFDWLFLKFVWAYPAKRRAAMLRRLAAATIEVITLRDAGEVEGYLDAIRHDNDDLVIARS
jgi:hypothetical protein